MPADTMIPTAKTANGLSRRILVIDDQEGVRSFLGRLISRMGLEVFVAESGSQALELLDGARFDLYLLDVRMPGLNGLETLRGIRRVDPSAAVVMMTGYADEEILEGVRAEGVLDILPKPLDLRHLRGIIETALGP